MTQKEMKNLVRTLVVLTPHELARVRRLIDDLAELGLVGHQSGAARSRDDVVKNLNRVESDETRKKKGMAMAIFNEVQVRSIRKSKKSAVELAKQYGVAKSTISNMCSGKTYSWVK